MVIDAMNNGILIIAHAPLASALQRCVAHVFPDRAEQLLVLDVQPQDPPEATLARAQALAASCDDAPLLMLTDLPGATPCNVARRLLDHVAGRLVAGLNLPMLLRAVSYQHEPMDVLLEKVLQGGAQCIQEIGRT